MMPAEEELVLAFLECSFIQLLTASMFRKEIDLNTTACNCMYFSVITRQAHPQTCERQQLDFGYLHLCQALYQPLGRRT